MIRISQANAAIRQFRPSSSRHRIPVALAICCLLGFLGDRLLAQPTAYIDIAQLTTQQGQFLRASGHTGSGRLGLPVAGPGDLDGDGLNDLAFSAILASPLQRSGAGEVYVVFGSGDVRGSVDTAVDQPRILRIAGDVNRETAGNEIWIDDVTGDGIDDLLIGRQNFTPEDGRIGAGALTILVGGSALRTFASRLEYLDLRDPDPSLTLFTIVGEGQGDRFGIWMRTGDVDGDGVHDLVTAADQENVRGELDSGATYLIRGGAHLAQNESVAIHELAGSPLEGHVAKLIPPPGATNYHTGATNNLLDLDGNGRTELLTAAALNRGGASVSPEGLASGRATGGSENGTLYIAWDDNFTTDRWPTEFLLVFGMLPGGETIIDGAPVNGIFGEEIVGGLDFDGDTTPDLFVGDFEADESRSRFFSGTGYAFYNAALLKNRQFSMGIRPEDIRISTILGPSAGAIGADTAAVGDFNGDGLGDLAFGSPHHSPQGRQTAGQVDIFFGQQGGWPARMDTANLPGPAQVRSVQLHGARGRATGDTGDTLSYSASAGDVDGDGLTDLITNEMVGNGIGPGTIDVGNLIVLGGGLISELAPPLYFAQFGNGGGFTSDIVTTNPSESLPATAIFNIRDDAGDPLPVMAEMTDSEGGVVAGTQLASTFEATIPPLGGLVLRTDGEGDIQVGAVSVLGNLPLGGVIRFSAPTSGITGVGSGSPVRGFISPVRIQNGINTGIALQNPGDIPISVQLHLRTLAGAELPNSVGFTVVNLPPRGHLARFITDLFPDLGPGDFEGTLTAQSADLIVGVAIEQGQQLGQFTTLPVTPR